MTAKPAKAVATKSQIVASDVTALLRARNPLLWIKTTEEARVEGYLAEAAGAAAYIPMTWDCAQGFAPIGGKPLSDSSEDPGSAFEMIRQRAEGDNGKEPERNVWIMRDLAPWLTGPGAMPTVRRLRNLARSLPGTPRNRAQAIIVVTPLSDIPPELAGHATVIEWPMPDREEIARILDTAINALPDDIKKNAVPNGTRDAAIDAATGLSGEEAQANFARSLVQTRTVDPILIAKEKKRVIARDGLIEWYDPIQGGLDSVGGLDNLKAWLNARRSAYSPAARAYGLPAPKGAMLVGIPGCLRGDSRVLLADGRMPSLETLARQASDCLVPGEYDVSVRVQLENGQSALATKLQIHSARPTVLVTFRDGRQIEATPDHQVLTPNGWVAAANLKAKDKVMLWNRADVSLTTPPLRTKFDRPLHSVRKRRIQTDRLPEIWNAELAELIGLFLAEGNKDNYRVCLTISSEETELAQWIRDRVTKLFGIAPHEFTKAGKRVRGFRVDSFDAAVNLHPLMLGDARSRRIPDAIFFANSGCIAACLRGLFEGDGTVANANRNAGSRRAPRVELKTASVGLARDVQLLLQRLGIPAAIQHDPATDCYAVRVSSTNSLTRYATLVGFLTARKRDKLALGLASLQRRTKNGFAEAAEVVSVVPSAQDHVYDLTVPEAERFIANGLVVHNCGKSLTAKAIATAWGVPLLRLDLGALQSKFVGESQANLRKALRIIEAIGRCIVWLDEIEKALQGATSGAADGGVSSDALGTILSWMQERTNEAFVMATANDVTGLPPELLRKGRFDEIWFVDLPNALERVEVVKASLRSYKRSLPESDVQRIADACDGFTGAEIAAMVPEAMFTAFADGERDLTVADLLQVKQSVVPLTKTAGEKIQKLRDWAVNKARPATAQIATRIEPQKVAARQLDL